MEFMVEWSKSWVGGSVVERRPDKTKVDGSIPSRPTASTSKNGFLDIIKGLTGEILVVIIPTVRSQSW